MSDIIKSNVSGYMNRLFNTHKKNIVIAFI